MMPDICEEKKDSTTKKILDALLMGTGTMVVLAPIVNAFNQWSVVAGRYNLSDGAAFRYIFQGNLNGSNYSLLNFRAGIGGHFTKEIPRVFFKSTGLYMYKPWLSTQLTPNYADIAFAGTLAVAEMVINPADTWRVNAQAGTRLVRSIPALYAGSLANGMRQFGTWWGFSYSNHVFNDALNKKTNIDPHSMTGIAIKSFPQALFYTSLVYGIERTKNELQYNPAFKQNNSSVKNNRYAAAVAYIWREQGIKGFFRGFQPKVLSNTVTGVGALVMLELGQKSMQNNK